MNKEMTDEEFYSIQDIEELVDMCLTKDHNLKILQSQLEQQLSQLQQENKQLKADYGNKAQVERDILKQENIDLKQKMIRILENIDVSYNDWKKWKDELKDSDK